MIRSLRVATTLVVIVLASSYVLLRIDIYKTAHIIGIAKPGVVALARTPGSPDLPDRVALAPAARARNRRGHPSPIAGAVLLERGLGAEVTVLLAAIGFLLAIGRYTMARISGSS